jgi:hypothetical protein
MRSCAWAPGFARRRSQPRKRRSHRRLHRRLDLLSRGLPALLQAVKEDADVVLVVLDNTVTAMTGFQESPTSPGASRASIESVCRALGAERVEKVDPWNVAATAACFERAARAHGPSVIVIERSCPVYEARAGHEPPAAVSVDPEQCRSCGREPDGMRCTQARRRLLTKPRRAPPTARAVRADAGCRAVRRCPLNLCVQGYAGHIAAGEARGGAPRGRLRRLPGDGVRSAIARARRVRAHRHRRAGGDQRPQAIRGGVGT